MGPGGTTRIFTVYKTGFKFFLQLYDFGRIPTGLHLFSALHFFDVFFVNLHIKRSQIGPYMIRIRTRSNKVAISSFVFVVLFITYLRGSTLIP